MGADRFSSAALVFPPRCGVVVACWWDGTPQRAAGDLYTRQIFEFRPVHRVRGEKVAIARWFGLF